MYDVAVIGAGPAGLICARNAARRGLSVALVDRHDRPGVKLSMAGGGRGNFTNRTLSEEHYVTDDPSLVRAVLRAFPCEWTLDLLRSLRLPFEERDFGQIFGLRPAAFLADRLAVQCDDAGVDFYLGSTARDITPPSASSAPAFGRKEERRAVFSLLAGRERIEARRLVAATGSPAFPSVGVNTDMIRLAARWGHSIVPFRPVLTPLVMPQNWPLAGLEGISLNARAGLLREGQELWPDPEGIRPLLFTHRGISGPAALVISCWWREGDELLLDLLPELSVTELLDARESGKMLARNILARHLPARLADALCPEELARRKAAELSRKDRLRLAGLLRGGQGGAAAPCGGGAPLPHPSGRHGGSEKGRSRGGRRILRFPLPPSGKPRGARALLLRGSGGCGRASRRLQHTLGLCLRRSCGRGAETEPEG